MRNREKRRVKQAQQREIRHKAAEWKSKGRQRHPTTLSHSWQHHRDCCSLPLPCRSFLTLRHRFKFKTFAVSEKLWDAFAAKKGKQFGSKKPPSAFLPWLSHSKRC